MQKHEMNWFSPNLQKEMPIVSYGHYGFALLLVPTAAADYLEYERFQLIDALKPHIDAGKIRVFSVNSINNESWLNNNISGEQKMVRHKQFNNYIYDEVVPFIKTNTSEATPIIICGASFGALHSMNLFLKRPDLIDGVIAMSGVYDLTEYSKGFYSDDVYFNSPIHYIPNLTDHNILTQIRNGRIIIATGSGAYEDPEANRRFSGVLQSKGIGHIIDIWGEDITHDWPTWRKMLPYFIDTKFH
jgi:esterase/lipase superfamily enzyme